MKIIKCENLMNSIASTAVIHEGVLIGENVVIRDFS